MNKNLKAVPNSRSRLLCRSSRSRWNDGWNANSETDQKTNVSRAVPLERNTWNGPVKKCVPFHFFYWGMGFGTVGTMERGLAA